MQPHGYGMPPPPAPKGPSLGLVVLVCLLAAFFFVPLVVGGVMGFLRYKERAEGIQNAKKKVVDPAKVELSEKYATKNGLLIAHYPADFAAKRVDNVTITVSRRVGNADEFLTLGALPVSKAVTDDIEEFARLMLVSVEKNVEAKNGTATRGKKRETKCLGKYEGVEYSPTFSVPSIGEYVGKACYFTHSGVHYIVRYDVVASHADEDKPLLERIAKATELPEPDDSEE
jgi:hypothetical protein